MAPTRLTCRITCAVEEPLKATSPKASDAPTSSSPESRAAHAGGFTSMDAQQQLPQDLINDLAASEAVMQDGLATAVESLTGSASKAQQAAASNYSMDADIGDLSPPSSIPDGGVVGDADLSDAAAEDLAAAAEEAAHAATPSTDGEFTKDADLLSAAAEDLAAAAEEAAHAAPPSAADESPDASSTAESAPQEIVTSDPADSGPVSPPSTTPDGADFLPSNDGLSDAAAEDLAAAAEEAAHSAADESSEAEVSGTHVSALQSFLLSTIPDGNRLPQDGKFDAVAENLAAAADAAAQTSASSSQLQTDAGFRAPLDSDTEQGTEGIIGLVLAGSSSSSSVSPPLELQTSIVSDLSEIQLLRSQVCILHNVSSCLSVCTSVCMFACLAALQALRNCVLTNSSMSSM